LCHVVSPLSELDFAGLGNFDLQACGLPIGGDVARTFDFEVQVYLPQIEQGSRRHYPDVHLARSFLMQFDVSIIVVINFESVKQDASFQSASTIERMLFVLDWMGKVEFVN